MRKAHQYAIEETLNEIETYLVRVTPRHRHQLRLLLRRLVRQCLKGHFIMKELEELLKRIEALEDRVRLLEYQLAPEERQEPEQESVWYPCATTGCGAQVQNAGTLCEACTACEELGFV